MTFKRVLWFEVIDDPMTGNVICIRNRRHFSTFSSNSMMIVSFSNYIYMTQKLFKITLNWGWKNILKPPQSVVLPYSHVRILHRYDCEYGNDILRNKNI